MAKKAKKEEAQAAAAGALRSRIVGHEDVDPAVLGAHPLNFRTHPPEQVDALRGSMNELGWIKGVIVNRATGRILDGHARVEEAKRQGLPTVPVDYVELSEHEEKIALAVLDPITEMAKRDQAKLDELLAQVQPEDEQLKAMLFEMTSAAKESKRDAGGSATIAEAYSVLVECADEAQQAELLERLTTEGLKCRSLIS